MHTVSHPTISHSRTSSNDDTASSSSSWTASSRWSSVAAVAATVEEEEEEDDDEKLDQTWSEEKIKVSMPHTDEEDKNEEAARLLICRSSANTKRWKKQKKMKRSGEPNAVDKNLSWNHCHDIPQQSSIQDQLLSVKLWFVLPLSSSCPSSLSPLCPPAVSLNLSLSSAVSSLVNVSPNDTVWTLSSQLYWYLFTATNMYSLDFFPSFAFVVADLLFLLIITKESISQQTKTQALRIKETILKVYCCNMWCALKRIAQRQKRRSRQQRCDQLKSSQGPSCKNNPGKAKHQPKRAKYKEIYHDTVVPALWLCSPFLFFPLFTLSLGSHIHSHWDRVLKSYLECSS